MSLPRKDRLGPQSRLVVEPRCGRPPGPVRVGSVLPTGGHRPPASKNSSEGGPGGQRAPHLSCASSGSQWGKWALGTQRSATHQPLPASGPQTPPSPADDTPREGHPSGRPAGVPPTMGPALTLQAWPSSRAALWASAGFSITLPVCPEKSMATREFSETLRWKKRPHVLSV